MTGAVVILGFQAARHKPKLALKGIFVGLIVKSVSLVTLFRRWVFGKRAIHHSFPVLATAITSRQIPESVTHSGDYLW